MKYTRLAMPRIMGESALQISMEAPLPMEAREGLDPFMLASLEFEEGFLSIMVTGS